jgi:hypothetical protein
MLLNLKGGAHPVRFSKKFFLQIGWFLVLGGFQAREIDWSKSQVPKKFFWPPIRVPHVKKSIFSTFLFWLIYPDRGSQKIFRTRDLRQSVSRVRKPPSTKNQPIWRKNVSRRVLGVHSPPFKPLFLIGFV